MPSLYHELSKGDVSKNTSDQHVINHYLSSLRDVIYHKVELNLAEPLGRLTSFELHHNNCSITAILK